MEETCPTTPDLQSCTASPLLPLSQPPGNSSSSWHSRPPCLAPLPHLHRVLASPLSPTLCHPSFLPPSVCSGHPSPRVSLSPAVEPSALALCLLGVLPVLPPGRLSAGRGAGSPQRQSWVGAGQPPGPCRLDGGEGGGRGAMCSIPPPSPQSQRSGVRDQGRRKDDRRAECSP